MLESIEGNNTMKKLLLILSFVFVSCINPTNLNTASQYFNGGKHLISQNKWFDGRMAFARAWDNARVGGGKQSMIAVYAYEYGRASGAICSWKQAEKGLLKALNLDKKTNGPIHMTYVELARMYHAQGLLGKSNKYFSLGKVELDKLPLDKIDVIAYTKILDEYVNVLSKLKKYQEAKLIKKRSNHVRNTYRNRKNLTDFTPYGKFCHQKEKTSKLKISN